MIAEETVEFRLVGFKESQERLSSVDIRETESETFFDSGHIIAVGVKRPRLESACDSIKIRHERNC